MDDIMTLEEVAKYLRVSERTIINWVQSGELIGGKLGTSWRFKRAVVEKWVDRKLTPRLSEVTENGQSLSSLLAPERTALLTCTKKSEVLQRMIDLCMTIPDIKNRQELEDAIFKRESLMSTGIGLGLGVPHARLNSLKNVYMAVGVNHDGIDDYESLDGEPVHIITMILAGRDQHAQYIKTLAMVAKLLKNADVRDRILQSSSSESLFRMLTGQEWSE